MIFSKSDLVGNAFISYIELTSRANIKIVKENFKELYTDDWYSIDYNGYNEMASFRVKLLSLKIILEQALKNKISYSLHQFINGIEYEFMTNETELYQVGKKRHNLLINRLTKLKNNFKIENDLYIHKNSYIQINGIELENYNNLESKISDFNCISYGSIMELLQIEENYSNLRAKLVGSEMQKDKYLAILDKILFKIGAVDELGNCLMNNRGGINNRSILWAIKDLFCSEGLFFIGLSDPEYMQALWKYMGGQIPIPKKRHKINNSTKKDNDTFIRKQFTEFFK
ncbi:hypothetical protein LZQ00_06460 [Sphingobacterium sp. SRCM116780]|uniref:hypothetical protein n=1 Tax=Sphingobacterium sp. SRCM116780 TaxID=2907623 RepID=UPI001F15BCD4|nr:hypothetical protein [Sphingobacterium sp. SRCM116780]UIR57456.1 hypothetical protein LZQ00_06460 [Sphingobacterium sp. SRCM116780]